MTSGFTAIPQSTAQTEAGTTWVQVLRQGGPAVNLLRVR
jgi:hypothetical protein